MESISFKNVSSSLVKVEDSLINLAYIIKIMNNKPYSIIFDADMDIDRTLENCEVRIPTPHNTIESFCNELRNTCQTIKATLQSDIQELRLACGSSSSSYLVSIGKLQPANMIVLQGK